jgi:hypothetical protein
MSHNQVKDVYAIVRNGENGFWKKGVALTSTKMKAGTSLELLAGQRRAEHPGSQVHGDGASRVATQYEKTVSARSSGRPFFTSSVAWKAETVNRHRPLLRDTSAHHCLDSRRPLHFGSAVAQNIYAQPTREALQEDLPTVGKPYRVAVDELFDA